MSSKPVAHEDLAPGDHIAVRRLKALYAHHGVYVGDGKVIHFTDAAGVLRKPLASVVETTLEEFLGGGALRRVNHRRRLHPTETLARARRMLQRRGYSLAWNNCEHFAAYCATGKRRSGQVRRAVTAAASFAAVVVGSTLVRRRSKAV